MKRVVAIGEAKTNLSRLLAQVEQGDEIVIRRGPRPIAKLTAYEEPWHRPLFGALRGKISIGDDFDETVPGFEPYT